LQLYQFSLNIQGIKKNIGELPLRHEGTKKQKAIKESVVINANKCFIMSHSLVP